MQMNGESNNNNNSTTATKPGGIAHVVQDDRSWNEKLLNSILKR